MSTDRPLRQSLCSKRGDGVGSAFPVCLIGLGSHGGSLGSVKTNAVGLDVRNLMRSPKHGEGSVTQFFVNLGHSGLEIRFAAWACDWLLWVKSCPILANGGMV